MFLPFHLPPTLQQPPSAPISPTACPRLVEPKRATGRVSTLPRGAIQGPGYGSVSCRCRCPAGTTAPLPGAQAWRARQRGRLSAGSSAETLAFG